MSSHGSEKSTFTENSLAPKGYILINQDNLKSKDKIKKYPFSKCEKGDKNCDLFFKSSKKWKK